jgi:hypothetical protein
VASLPASETSTGRRSCFPWLSVFRTPERLETPALRPPARPPWTKTPGCDTVYLVQYYHMRERSAHVGGKDKALDSPSPVHTCIPVAALLPEPRSSADLLHISTTCIRSAAEPKSMHAINAILQHASYHSLHLCVCLATCTVHSMQTNSAMQKNSTANCLSRNESTLLQLQITPQLNRLPVYIHCRCVVRWVDNPDRWPLEKLSPRRRML